MAASTDGGFRPDGAGNRAPVRPQFRHRTPRHEIRALLRAHLAAATGYRHLTRHCAVCARLLRLAMEPAATSPDTEPAGVPSGPSGAPQAPREAIARASAAPPGGAPPSGGPGPVPGGRRSARRAGDESPPAA